MGKVKTVGIGLAIVIAAIFTLGAIGTILTYSSSTTSMIKSDNSQSPSDVKTISNTSPTVSSEQSDRLDRITKLELNNTVAIQKYLESINESNVTKKIELYQEAKMYANGTWAETCRLYPDLEC